MAKKTRTPPPPRPVQAPKRRYQPTRRGGPSSRSWLVGGAATAAVAVVILVVALLGRGGGGSGADPTQKLAAAGCTFQTYPDQGRNHLQSLDARIKYNSFPPTSGRHYFQPAIWGSYTQPLALVQEVHNLEHGGVIIQYGDKAAESTIGKVSTFVSADPNGMLLAALPQLGAKIALTAWTHLATCNRFDEAAFKAFRGAYRAKGPERVPLSALQPGS